MRLLLSLLLTLTATAQVSDPISLGDARFDADCVPIGSDTLLVLAVAGADTTLAGVLRLTTRATDGALTREEAMLTREGSWSTLDTFALDPQTMAPPGDDAFYGNSLDVLLAALPLGEGFAAQVLLGQPDGPPQPAELSVTAAETVRAAQAPGTNAPAGGYDCPAWRVDVLHQGKPSAYWIGRASGRLVRFASPAEGIEIRRIGC
jgi:hypothetical protein